ncbi:hypothetical protein [Methanoregula sp.]|uniref:hypothetical protein n=1 Tax=Methanoregula sp. TaxID=2052170 RepID=UPI00236977A5|nr:hypothetical protein [Methanoregula sp.]MDD1687591.1 hypothetical protein [Methanoregula sp.]
MSTMNSLLNIFGQEKVNWSMPGEMKAPVEESTTPPVNSAPVTYAYAAKLPSGPGVYTFDTISGQSGYQRHIVPVYYDNWEVWYTVEPVESEQNSHLSSPSFKIVITDLGSGQKIATIEPPGGLDATLWKQYDPRPWSNSFSGEDDRVYSFDITANDVKSYLIEVKRRRS